MTVIVAIVDVVSDAVSDATVYVVDITVDITVVIAVVIAVDVIVVFSFNIDLACKAGPLYKLLPVPPIRQPEHGNHIAEQ